MKDKIISRLVAALGVCTLLAFLYLLYAAIGCWIWGMIMVGVFGLPNLSFWQMYCLMWLIRLMVPNHLRMDLDD